MASFSQDNSSSKTQQGSYNSHWMTQNQAYFELHRPLSASSSLSNFWLFHNTKLEVIGSQIAPMSKGSGKYKGERGCHRETRLSC